MFGFDKKKPERSEKVSEFARQLMEMLESSSKQ